MQEKLEKTKFAGRNYFPLFLVWQRFPIQNWDSFYTKNSSQFQKIQILPPPALSLIYKLLF